MRVRIAAGVLLLLLGALAVVASRIEPPPSGPSDAELRARLPQRAREIREEVLLPAYERLKPLHHPLRPLPLPGEWLASQPEPGQTFAEYQRSKPLRPGAPLTTVYLQQLGELTPERRQVLDEVAEYTAIFLGVPVKRAPELPLELLPQSAVRVGAMGLQLWTTAILRDLLLPRRPADALGLMAVTERDLYPEPSWNFVFGEAVYGHRVGVFSLRRFPDPSDSEEERRGCLRHGVATATHELLHMIGLEHCVAWGCVINGSNSLEESERTPLQLCPSCLQKLMWNVGGDPARRFEQLAEFGRRHGLDEDLAYFDKARALLTAPQVADGPE